MNSFKNVIAATAICLVLIQLIECESEPIKLMYKSNVTLDCSKLNEPKFYRRKVSKNETFEPIEITKSDKYHIEDNKLTINDLRRDDIESTYWCESDGKKQTFESNVQPYIAKPEKVSQTIVEGGYVELVCRLLYGNETNSTGVSWKWIRNNTELVSNEKLTIESKPYETRLNISKVGEQDRGEYECHLSNEYGTHKEKIQVRVKDALAALWPFLAIVAEVIVLCLIILIYEKRCAKKSSATEEDNEQTQNFLNNDHSDVKKRNPKA